MPILNSIHCTSKQGLLAPSKGWMDGWMDEMMDGGEVIGPCLATAAIGPSPLLFVTHLSVHVRARKSRFSSDLLQQ